MSTWTRVQGNDGESEEDQTVANQWIAFGSRVAIRIALHPLEYAKVLIQVSKYTTSTIYHFKTSPT